MDAKRDGRGSPSLVHARTRFLPSHECRHSKQSLSARERILRRGRRGDSFSHKPDADGHVLTRRPRSRSLSMRMPQVLEATRKGAGPDCYVFANISACAVGDVLAHARAALASSASPNALLLLPPFYMRPFNASDGARCVRRAVPCFLSTPLSRAHCSNQSCASPSRSRLLSSPFPLSLHVFLARM